MNIENIFDFIKEKRGYDYPLKYKLINHLPLPEHDGMINHYGNLDLRFANINSLPDNLYVHGSLSIEYSMIDSIPNNLVIERYFFIYNTPLAKRYNRDEIKKMIVDKGGYNGVTIP